MAANKAALETKGQKPADTKKMQANVETINELETLRSHLFDDGQALCQRNDKAWLRAYIHKQLLKQMRRASPVASAVCPCPGGRTVATVPLNGASIRAGTSPAPTFNGIE